MIAEGRQSRLKRPGMYPGVGALMPTPQGLGFRMRVLLVEDDRMIGAAVEQALKDAAYAVDWVTDGETAIQASQTETYELALLDLGLPATDGQEILRQLRGLGRRLPVIIVTARDAIDDRIDGLDLGADDYLVKPFEIRELLARMRAVLRRQAGSSPIPATARLASIPLPGRRRALARPRFSLPASSPSSRRS